MADLPRFFLPEDSFSGKDIIVTGDALRHLRLVLRLKEGAQAIVLDGSGTCSMVRFSSICRDAARAEALSTWRETETALPVCLQQAIPKGDKFELILQKATELGVTTFQPVITERSVPRLDPKRLMKRCQRWSKIISEAARQSRRAILPHLDPVFNLDEVLKSHSENLRLVLWEAGAISLADRLPQKRPTGVTLLVGPEGGFAHREIKLIEEAGYLAVHLGPRILRTETAGLAATSILQYLYGDLQQAPEIIKEMS